MVYFVKITDCGVQLFIRGSSTALLAGFLMTVDDFVVEIEVFDAEKSLKIIKKFLTVFIYLKTYFWASS